MSYFFFQAEDGIRDIGVTGVQTCALPILIRPPDPARSALDKVTSLREQWPHGDRHARIPRPAARGVGSEERRVGKECRARWAPDHYEKKKGENNRGHVGKQESTESRLESK